MTNEPLPALKEKQPKSKTDKKKTAAPKKRSRIKNVIYNLLLILFSSGFTLVIVFIIGEIWIRSQELPPDSGSIYIIREGKLPRVVLRPGAEEIAAGARVHINQLGFRGREYTREKPSGAKRILILGDSFAFGAGAPEEVIFPTRLEKQLNQNESSQSIEVINLGVVDYNTDDSLTRLKEFGLELKPDLVLLFYVMNDIEIKREYLPKPENETGAKAEKESGEERRYRDPLYSMVDSLRRNSHFLAYLAPRIASLGRRMGFNIPSSGHFYSTAYKENVEGWRRSKAALKQIHDLGKEHGFQFALALFPLLTNLTESYPARESHQVIGEFAQQEGIPFLDLFPAYEGKNATSLWVSPTDGHPNEEGHRIAAEAVYRFLQENPYLLDGNPKKN